MAWLLVGLLLGDCRLVSRWGHFVGRYSMARPRRVCKGGLVYHALNRANGEMEIFCEPGDYGAFEGLLREACERVGMRLLSYCVMPNHWHLVLWPRKDGDLSEFMRWLTMTHTQRWHCGHETVGRGHLYQGRFKSFPVQSERYYLTVCRYVERNALQAGLVEAAEDWRWGSLWHRLAGRSKMKDWVAEGPMALPGDWVTLVNRRMHGGDMEGIRESIERGRPLGSAEWVSWMAGVLGQGGLRSRGRPPKAVSACGGENGV